MSRLHGLAKVSGARVEGSRLRAAAQVRGSRTSAALVYLARRMEVQAVFFDLDDTLVLTHAADRSAHQAVSRLLATRVPSLDHQAVVDHFVQLFISQPWDPHKQDVQSCFDSERLLAFQWADGVEAVLSSRGT